MHILSAALALLGLTLANPGCTRQDGTRDASSGPQVHARTMQVDPMAFVTLYHAEFEKIIEARGGDCDAALAVLSRFVADHREVFFEKLEAMPSGWQPEVANGQRSIQAFMEFAKRCPEETARLNETIHAITR